MDSMKAKVQKVLHSEEGADHHTPETTRSTSESHKAQYFQPGMKSGYQKTVLITGGSGFVGAHVLKAFLKHGYTVRTTARSQASADKIKESHPLYVKSLEFVIVPDIQASGAYDEAVKGVNGVIHLASPFVTTGITNNEKELLDPAINGTKSLLLSVSKFAPEVNRVVIISSFAAIWNGDKGNWPEHTYTEVDWNPVTYGFAASPDAPGPVAYCASKTFAEKAAWDFVNENHPHFQLTTLCPPMIYGPVAHKVENLDSLNTSSADIYRFINGSEKDIPATGFPAFVDVRDIAEAHLKAYELDSAAGQRYFVTGGSFTYQQVCDIIRRDFPQLKDKVPTGGKGQTDLSQTWKVDNSKARKELGINFKSLESCIHDTVEEFLKLEKTLPYPQRA